MDVPSDEGNFRCYRYLIVTKYWFHHNKFCTKNYIQPFLFCYFTSSLSHKKFQTQSSLTKSSKASVIHKVPNESSLSPIQKASPYYRRFILTWPSPIDSLLTDSLLVGLLRRFSSQQFAPHHRRFASRRSVATLQLATVRASPSLIRFSPVHRNTSARNGSRLTIADSLLAGPLRRFNSKRFVPHRRRFASRRSVATLSSQWCPSHYLRRFWRRFSPSHHRRHFAFHPAGNSSPPTQPTNLCLPVFFFFLLS